MNILPLVFTFLIIFSCISLGLFREIKSFFLIETTLESYHRTERVLNNAINQKSYRKIKGEATSSKAPSQHKSKSFSFTSKRELFPSLENSKFNLSVLVKHVGEFHLHPLYEPFAEFLRLLYKKKIFDKEERADVEYFLLEAMLKKAQKSPNTQDLAELFPEDPVLAKIFYKMLQGTNQYTRTAGIPPLRNFVSLEPESKAVSLSFASPVLLEAVFGSKIASIIVQEEKKKSEELAKHYYFSKEDLQALLIQHPGQGFLMSTLEPFFDYSKHIQPRTQIGGRDARTGIGLEKAL